MGRAPCCDKANVKRGPWSPEEDAKLKAYIEQHGTGGNWIALPQKIGLKRCGKSCRLRWLNYLRPNIKHGGFSEEEDNIICSLYISIGSRWSIIAAQLPGRTDNDVKNYWNTRLKRKLLGKQRKEPKQEMKNQNENFMISERESQTPYYPEPPVPYPNQDPRLADHASIRKLLIRLGGRFSDDQIQSSSEGTDLRGPFDISNSQLLYQNSINLVSSSSSMNSFTNTSSIANNQYGMDNVFTHHMPQGFSANPFELDEMIYCNTQRLGGFDCLYGKGMVNESNGTNSIESTSWGDTNYEFYQGMVQEGVFGGPKHLASQ